MTSIIDHYNFTIFFQYSLWIMDFVPKKITDTLIKFDKTFDKIYLTLLKMNKSDLNDYDLSASFQTKLCKKCSLQSEKISLNVVKCENCPLYPICYFNLPEGLSNQTLNKKLNFFCMLDIFIKFKVNNIMFDFNVVFPNQTKKNTLFKGIIENNQFKKTFKLEVATYCNIFYFEIKPFSEIKDILDIGYINFGLNLINL